MREGEIRIDVNDIIGKRSGKLEVIEYTGHAYAYTNGGRKVRHFYRCRCDCGNIHVCQRGPLKNGIIRSCGCLRRKKK